MIQFIVREEETNQTLEKYVKKVLKEAPLSFIYKLFRKKDIKINGHWADAKTLVQTNDVISIYATDEQLVDFRKPNIIMADDAIKDAIIYEDKNILLINKPRNVLVQPDNTNSKSLDRMVLSYLFAQGEYNPTIDLAFTPGPAHRLDRNTSGIVIFGKNIQTLQYLFNIIKDREEIAKRYLVLVSGDVAKDGNVDVPLYKDEKSGKVFVGDKSRGAKSAKSIYHVVERFGDYTLLEVILVTGRTHQIRVHMSYINHPVVGDAKYGDFNINHEFEKNYHFKNQFLHAYKISFGTLEKPLDYLSKKAFDCPLPKEEQNILEQLRKRQQ